MGRREHNCDESCEKEMIYVKTYTSNRGNRKNNYVEVLGPR